MATLPTRAILDGRHPVRVLAYEGKGHDGAGYWTVLRRDDAKVLVRRSRLIFTR